MSLSSHEAQASLAEAEQARRRSAQLYGYRKASPHLIMWGLIWVVGYSCINLLPKYEGYIWDALVVAGILGSIYLGRSSHRYAGVESKGPYAWRAGAIGILALTFISSTYAIMWPVHGSAMAAYPALITGTIYAGVGLWLGVRYVVTGALVIGFTMFGFFYLPAATYFYWMALVGGGSMILAGAWFRRV